MISSRQLLIALRLSVTLMKELLIAVVPGAGWRRPERNLPLALSFLVAASTAHWSAISFPTTPACPGTQSMDMLAPC